MTSPRPSPRRKRRSIDWQEVRETLQRVHGAGQPTDLTPEQARAALDDRARVLARRPIEPAGAGDALNILTFGLGGEHFAIETTFVREVVRLLDFTPVPGLPDFIVGVTNYRGHILCVIDLRSLVGAPSGVTDRSKVVVIGTETAELGVLADSADATTSLPATELVSPSESVAAIGSEYLLGVTRQALLVLNGARLLQDPRLFVDHRESETL